MALIQLRPFVQSLSNLTLREKARNNLEIAGRIHLENPSDASGSRDKSLVQRVEVAPKSYNRHLGNLNNCSVDRRRGQTLFEELDGFRNAPSWDIAIQVSGHRRSGFLILRFEVTCLPRGRVMSENG